VWSIQFIFPHRGLLAFLRSKTSSARAR